MSFGEVSGESECSFGQLDISPPFIWPEARLHARVATYSETPPTRSLFAEADLVSAVLVGAEERTLMWLDELLEADGKRDLHVVLVLYPACPTREDHLKLLSDMKEAYGNDESVLDIRLVLMDDDIQDDTRRTYLPPTVIQAHNSRTGKTVMSIGSVADAGNDAVELGSLNLVFHPDDATRDAWRRWFQYLLSSATPLTPETACIPHLVPAVGDPAARELWEAYEKACLDGRETHQPKVDPETGEVTAEPDGTEVTPWDGETTKLEPLARVIQDVYAKGWLVTVDEVSRIKPLTIPVKATLLGQLSERSVGAIKQKQSFSLQVLDDAVDKAVEKCRKVQDVLELLSYPLSKGNRWLPEAAKELLERELASRNKQGQKALKEALGGDIDQFIASRADSIRKDLTEMHRQLGQGDKLPEDKLATVLNEVKQRLEQALTNRITPRAVYNRIGAPDLTANAQDENWNQPLALLERSALELRHSLTDSYFPRKFVGMSFSEEEHRKACDVFGDTIVTKPDMARARNELKGIDEILKSDCAALEKCKQIWNVIKGNAIEPKS